MAVTQIYIYLHLFSKYCWRNKLSNTRGISIFSKILKILLLSGGFEAQDPQNRVQEPFLIWNQPFDSNFREDFEKLLFFDIFDLFNHQNRLRNQILCILMCLISFLKIFWILWRFSMILDDEWWFSVMSDDSRWWMMILDDEWWFSMMSDDSRWWVMILGDEWWLMMMSDDSWWCVVLLNLFRQQYGWRLNLSNAWH